MKVIAVKVLIIVPLKSNPMSYNIVYTYLQSYPSTENAS